MTIISLDTETTGLDLHHGAKPYFVTSCNQDGAQSWWEVDVDPLTREPLWSRDDLAEVRALVEGGTRTMVLQNAKFDCAALKTLVPDLKWPWGRTEDTLIAGHLLASNQLHDLTSMTLHYLGVNIQPFEDALEDATQAARRYCRRYLKDWRIASAGEDDMPSVKGGSWKLDGWLPRALLEHEGLDTLNKHFRRDVSGWATVLRDYGNADSAATVALWQEMAGRLKKRGLWQIYQERRKLVEISHDMEQRGVTVNGENLLQLEEEYRGESDRLGRLCVNIAGTYGVELHLPKAGNNKVLSSFILNTLKCPVLKRSKKTGAPSLDASVLEQYEQVLEPRSKGQVFIKSLNDKRKRDTSLTYMQGYRRFMLPAGGDPGCVTDRRPAHSSAATSNRVGGRSVASQRLIPCLPTWFVLHPSVNVTGTDTLRWSFANPNSSNVSKRMGFNLRCAFGPAPGREWWSLDAKNIELRIPAYESGQTEVINLFERPDDPPYYGSTHLLNFHVVYPDLWGKELAEVGLEQVGPRCKKKYASTYYQYVKNGGFAIQYGSIDRADGTGTADKAFHRPGSHKLLKERFSKLEELNKKWIRYAEKYGYVETLPDRSVDLERGYPVLCTRTEWGKILPTVPLNYHVQSTAMWWTARGMVKCEEQLKKWGERRIGGDPHSVTDQTGASGRPPFLVLQVHDEIVFDFPKRAHPVDHPDNSNLARVKILAELMASTGDDFIPPIKTPVGIEFHPEHWGEGITLQ